jgi:hypothetical protein
MLVQLGNSTSLVKWERRQALFSLSLTHCAERRIPHPNDARLPTPMSAVRRCRVYTTDKVTAQKQQLAPVELSTDLRG